MRVGEVMRKEVIRSQHDALLGGCSKAASDLIGASEAAKDLQTKSLEANVHLNGPSAIERAGDLMIVAASQCSMLVPFGCAHETVSRSCFGANQ